MTDPALIAAVLGSGGLGAIATAFIGKRPTRIDVADQLQEMVDDLRATNHESQAREASLLNYIWTLQAHINTRKPPPPPAWPDDLVSR